MSDLVKLVFAIYAFIIFTSPAEAQTSRHIAERRNLIFPTAQTLPQGTWQYENYYLVLNNAYIGIHNHLTFNAGYGFYPEGERFKDDHVATIGVKWKFYERNYFMASVGANLYQSFYGKNFDVGYVYAAFGDQFWGWNWNGKIGYLVGKKNLYLFDKSASVLIGLDGMTAISGRWLFLTEINSIPSVDFFGIQHPVFVSLGLRYAGSRLTADLGMINVIGTGSFVGFPVINMIYQIR